MLLYFTAGFLIPLICGTYIFIKKPIIFVTTYPLGVALAHLFNFIGVYLNLWGLTPAAVNHISLLLFELGLYPIMASYFVLLLDKYKRLNPLILILSFTLLTTLVEWVGVKIGRVSYYNNWNIILTFFTYLIPYYTILKYYHFLNKNQLYK